MPAAAYVGSFLGLEWATVHLENAHGIAPWHPVAALTFTALLLGGRRYILPTFAAAIGGGALIWHINGTGVLLAALGYSAGYGLVADVLRRGLRFDPALHARRDVVLLTAAAVVAPALVALAGTAGLVAGGFRPSGMFVSGVRGWWLADSLGVLLLTPLACVARDRARGWKLASLPPPASDPGSWLCLLGGITLVPVVVWLGFDFGLAHGLHLYYLCFIPMLILSLRYELLGATAASATIGTAILVATASSSAGRLDTRQFIFATAVAALSFGTIMREREGARQALHEARNSLDALVRASPLAVLALDREGRVTAWTPAAERLFGWSEQEILGQSLPTVPDGLRHEFDEARRRLLHDGQVFSLETQRLHRDGTELDVSLSAAPLHDQQGAITGHVTFVTDITARKEAESGLRRRDAMLEAISAAGESLLRTGWSDAEIARVLSSLGPAADVSRVWLFENHLDGDGRFVASQRYEWASDHTTSEIDNPELQGVPWDAPIHRLWRAELERGRAVQLDACLAPGWEREMLQEQGIRSMAAVPIFVDETWWGHMGFDECRREREWSQAELDVLSLAAGVIGAALERRRAELALRESEQRFRTMADEAPALIWLADLGGNATFFNRAWLEFTGRSSPEELKDRWRETVHPDDQEAETATFHEAMRKREPYQTEYRLRRPDGTWGWVLDRGSPLFLESGELAGYVGSALDITERKAAEQERERLLGREREQVERLRELDQAKDHFLAAVSHELRTPLTSILGYLEFLADSVPDEERQLVAVADRNARRLLRLVGDLLLVAQAEAGQLSFDAVPVDLAAIAAEATENAHPSSLAKGVVLELAGSEARLVGDPTRLAQLFDNLVANGIKFTPAGGRVDVRVGTSEAGVWLEVADTGLGVSEADRARLFDRFFRADDAQRLAIQGTGLGLTIVKRIVDAHGGTIAVASQVGRGTTFRVELPRLGSSRATSHRAA